MDLRFKSKHLKLKGFLPCSVLAAAVFFGVSGWANSKPSVQLPTRGKPQVVYVELARTPDEWAKGLMGRKSLGEHEGMLFVFPEDEEHVFWMKDTLLSLDMIFIDREFRIVGVVERAVPGSLDPRTVGKPSRYVLEVQGGFSKRFGLKAGKTVKFTGFEIKPPIH